MYRKELIVNYTLHYYVLLIVINTGIPRKILSIDLYVILFLNFYSNDKTLKIVKSE